MTDNQQKQPSFSTIEYWENRYYQGNSSGEGSYGDKALYKADIINKIIKENSINSLIEFGCGDGNNLGLYEISKYIGFDVSKTAIELCINQYKNDQNKSFLYYHPFLFKSGGLKSELTISIEVLFHLVEEKLYKKYLNDLFESSSKYVVIFASNIEKIDSEAKHMVYRKFTDDISEKFELIETILTPKEKDMISDFYVFKLRIS